MAAMLETRLVIEGVDETAKAFASVEAKVKALSRSINSAAMGMGGSSGAAAQGATAGKAVRAAGGAMGSIAATASAAAGYAVAVGGVLAVREGVKAVAARQHEMVRMAVSGMRPDEIAEATVAAAKLTAEMPNVSATEALHMLRNARSIVGSYQEAAEIAEPLLKLRTLAQLARPGQDVSEDFDMLVKGLEIKGVTQNPAQFRQYMEGIAKGINVFGDTLKPYQYYEMFKYGRQATAGLSEKFILGTAPTLAQELGGSSYGRAVSAFNQAIVGGVLKTKAVDEFFRLGLLGDSDVKTLKSGNKQILAGKSVAGWREAQADPNAWVKDYLLPALDKLGIKDRESVMKEISVLFQNQMAGQMVGLLATQQARIDKDLALLGSAPGLAAADRAMREDPHLAFQGLSASVEGLVATLGQSADVGKIFAGAMTTAAQAIASFSAGLQEEKAAQDAGRPSPAIEETNRHLNRLIYGVDTSDRDDAARAAGRRGEDAAYAQKTNALLGEYDDAAGRAAGTGADAAIAREHQARVVEELKKLDFDWRSALPRRGMEDYQSDLAAARNAHAAGRDGPFGPEPGRPADYIAEAIRRAEAAVFGPGRPPDSGARTPDNVSVTGEVHGEIPVHIQIDPSPLLQATVRSMQDFKFAAPLSGAPAATGRMDSDAAPQRGGIGHM